MSKKMQDPKDIQLGVKITMDLADRLDRAAEAMTERALGTPITRAAIARTAIEKGLEVIEATLETAAKPTKKGKTS